MTELYIHVGTHKTGTTTIQNALRNLSERNPDEGIKYIKVLRTSKEFMRGEVYDKSLVRKFRGKLRRLVKRGKSVKRAVVSSEAFSGLPSNGYLNSGVVSSMLCDATSKYDVKIIVYLRRQDDFVESMYTQKIHEGESLDFLDFLKNFESPGALDYNRILRDFRSCFGDENLVIRSYHEASRRGLLLDFGEIIKSGSFPKTVVEGGDHENPSYSRPAFEIARTSNHFLDQGQKVRLRSALQTTLAKDKDEPFAFFSKPERHEFLERYRGSNREVADRYFSGNLKRLFPDPRGPTPVPRDGNLSYEQVAELVVELLKRNN